jgi:hypothetical protein
MKKHRQIHKFVTGRNSGSISKFGKERNEQSLNYDLERLEKRIIF